VQAEKGRNTHKQWLFPVSRVFLPVAIHDGDDLLKSCHSHTVVSVRIILRTQTAEVLIVYFVRGRRPISGIIIARLAEYP
jgi:hypothetical protein